MVASSRTSESSDKWEGHQSGLGASTRHWQKHSSAELPPADDPTVLQEPSSAPLRYLGGGRRQLLMGGMLFHVTRGAEGECTSRFQQLEAPCMLGAARQPYGTDPVFRPSSRLYRPELQDDMGAFYNTSIGSDMMSVQRKTSRRRPLPFRPRSLQSLPADVYPFFVDAGLSGYRAKQLFKFMEDGQAVDSFVQRIGVKFVLWNSEIQTWTLVDLTWDGSTGQFETEYHVSSVCTEQLANAVEYTFASVYNLLIHLSWILGGALELGYQVTSLVMHVAKKRSATSGTRLAHLQTYLCRPSVLANLFAAFVQMFTVAYFAMTLWYMTKLVQMQPPYEVYHDLYAGANYFLPSRGPVEGALTADVGSPSAIPAWARPEHNDGFNQYLQDVASVELLQQLLRYLFYLYGAQLLTRIVQLGVITYGQKRLAVVMRSSRDSIVTVMNLALPSIIVVASFAVLYQITIGSFVHHVSTLQKGTSTLFEMALLGEHVLLAVPGWELGPLVGGLLRLYQTLFVFLFPICIANFLFAQLSDVLMDHLKDARSSNTIAQDVRIVLRNRVKRKILREWPAMESVVVLLKHGEERHERRKKNLKRLSTIQARDGILYQTWSMRSLLSSVSQGDLRPRKKERLYVDRGGQAYSEKDLEDLLTASAVYRQRKQSMRRRATSEARRDLIAASKEVREVPKRKTGGISSSVSHHRSPTVVELEDVGTRFELADTAALIVETRFPREASDPSEGSGPLSFTAEKRLSKMKLRQLVGKMSEIQTSTQAYASLRFDHILRTNKLLEQVAQRRGGLRFSYTFANNNDGMPSKPKTLVSEMLIQLEEILTFEDSDLNPFGMMMPTLVSSSISKRYDNCRYPASLEVRFMISVTAACRHAHLREIRIYANWWTTVLPE
ncbi:hypothetical protein CYMTET_40799 [Cymbomonas tetramitiformis]|uniref:Uncharacterized protein n=1 Tax=Cymbomonas tetramitiformis TaxID=36881 RepID=A0AAE0C7F0_9CHLO|nr:hypothetical protein CYMTET_40799 [Cymbomonas tetramitiformis]